jgi:hypothetical protein
VYSVVILSVFYKAQAQATQKSNSTAIALNLWQICLSFKYRSGKMPNLHQAEFHTPIASANESYKHHLDSFHQVLSFRLMR